MGIKYVAWNLQGSSIRRRNVIAALFALVSVVIPNGAYGMRDLCEKLSAGGTKYTVEQRLSDYPVFVSTRTSDDSRVRELLAVALHAEWKSEGDGFILTPKAFDPAEEFTEFERQLRVAASENKVLLALSPKDLFEMPVGTIARYANRKGESVRVLPKSLGDTSNESYFMVRRLSRGTFETAGEVGDTKSDLFGDDSQLELRELPTAVVQALGKNVQTVALDEESKAQIATPAIFVATMRSVNISKQDMIATALNKSLLSLARHIDREFVTVLPDMVLFASLEWATGEPTVKDVLSSLNMMVAWQISGEAIVGALPTSEVRWAAQTRRQVLAKYMEAAENQGGASAQSIGDYVANQRPGASDSWADAMMLAMAGIVFDESYLGDYPYNMRLYSALSGNDWKLIRSGEPFGVSDFSPTARAAVGRLLLQSRTNMMAPANDPAFWPSLAPSNLAVTAALTEEVALSYESDGIQRVGSVEDAAANYDRTAQKLAKEPDYLVGTRRKLELTITSKVDPARSYVTGFSEFVLGSSKRGAVWSKLPAELAERFKAVLNSVKESEGSVVVGKP